MSPRCHFLHLNTNGLRARIPELPPLLDTCIAAALQDTRCSTLDVIRPLFPEFQVYGQQARSGTPGNVIMVHHSVRHRLITNVAEDGQSMIKVELHDDALGFSHPMYFSSIYAPPSRRHGVLKESFLDAASSSSYSLTMGDFNAHHRDLGARSNNANGLVLQQHLMNSPVILLNNPLEPTFAHTAHNYAACLDYALVSPGLAPRVASCHTAMDVGSDHLPLIVALRHTRFSHLHIPTGWHITPQLDYTSFQETLDNRIRNSSLWPYTPVANTPELTSRYLLLTDIIQDSARRTIPLRRPPNRQRPRLPPATLTLIRSRRRLKREYLAHPTTHLKHFINVLSRNIKRDIKDIKRDIEAESVRVIASGPRHPGFWPEIRRRFRPRNQDHTPLRNPDGPRQWITHPEDIVRLFEDHLRQVATDVPHPPSSPPSRGTTPTMDPLHTIPPLTPDEYLVILRRTRNGRAPGPDGIPYELLRYASRLTHETLTHFLNDVIRLAWVPPIMKESYTIFLPKEGRDASLITNFRPITLANCILKTLEFHVNHHLLRHLELHHILRPNQLAFRPGCGADDQLLDITERTIQSHNLGEITLMLSLDLNKAFDTVDHHCLLTALDQALQDPHATTLISQLSQSRSTRVRCYGQIGRPITPLRGVPQGSPLSPTLFNLVMAGAPQPNRSTTVQYCYADDVTLTSRGNTPHEAWTRVRPHLDRLVAWIQQQSLCLQPAKTQAIFLTRSRHRLTFPTLEIDGHPIRPSTTAKVLGITYDRSLNFTQHVKQLHNKCFGVIQTIRFLMQKNPGIPSYVGMFLHTALIQPRLTYGAPLLLLCSASTWRRLDQLHRHSLRAATRSPLHTPLQNLYVRAHSTPFRQIYPRVSTKVLQRHVRRRSRHLLTHLSSQPRDLRLAFTLSPLRRIYHSLTPSERAVVDNTLRTLDLYPP